MSWQFRKFPLTAFGSRNHFVLTMSRFVTPFSVMTNSSPVNLAHLMNGVLIGPKEEEFWWPFTGHSTLSNRASLRHPPHLGGSYLASLPFDSASFFLTTTFFKPQVDSSPYLTKRPVYLSLLTSVLPPSPDFLSVC